MSFEKCNDAVHIRHVTQGEHVGEIGARERRNDWTGALTKDELVVGYILFRAVRHFDANGLCRSVDGEDFVVNVRMHARTGPHFLRCHDEELLAVLDFAADEVRQSTVGKGNERAPLEDVYLGCSVPPAPPWGGRRSAGHTADDDDFSSCFHDLSLV